MDYKVGSILIYTCFGGGKRRVRVTEKDSNIKNGRPGFGGVVLNDGGEAGMGCWGYDDQIDSVEEF